VTVNVVVVDSTRTAATVELSVAWQAGGNTYAVGKITESMAASSFPVPANWPAEIWLSDPILALGPISPAALNAVIPPPAASGGLCPPMLATVSEHFVAVMCRHFTTPLVGTLPDELPRYTL
jgi:hypothetical protein